MICPTIRFIDRSSFPLSKSDGWRRSLDFLSSSEEFTEEESVGCGKHAGDARRIVETVGVGRSG